MNRHAIPTNAQAGKRTRPVSVLGFEAMAELIERLGDTYARDRIGGVSLDIVSGFIAGENGSTEVVVVVDPFSGSGVVVRWDQDLTAEHFTATYGHLYGKPPAVAA